MRSGFTQKRGATSNVSHNTVEAKRYIVTTHASLQIREDLSLSLLHASPVETPTHNNREKGNYSCQTLEGGTVYRRVREMGTVYRRV